jgi:AraC-like DNA-binding protein
MGNMLSDHPFYMPPPVSGSSFDEFLESFASSTPPFSARVEGGRGQEFRWWSSVVATPDVSLFRMRYTTDWSGTPETEDESLIAMLLFSGGRLEAVVGADEVTAVPQTALLVPAARVRRITTVNGPKISKANLVFSSTAVARVLSSMFGGVALSTIELAPLFDLTTSAGKTLNWFIHTLASGMVGERVLERSPKSMALLVEATLRFIFENVPHRFSHRLDQRGFLGIAPRYIKAAAEYMRANAHMPLTIAEVAAATGISVRALQAGFQHFWNTTPSAYLRHIRLEAVHKELSLPGNTLSIKEVALRWGFIHLGHFAARYRAVYGEQPSETVDKAQNRW